MISFGLASTSRRTWREVQVPGFQWSKSDYLMANGSATVDPTVHLVEQPGETVLPAHFHEQNQFQIFLEGSGRIGGHRIDGLMAHYAGAFTGYGPIVADPGGLKYLTLRARPDEGAFMLSDVRPPKGPRRGATASLSFESLRQAPIRSETVEMVAQKDGLGVYLRLASNDDRHALAVPSRSDGCFVIVLYGSVEIAGRRVTPWESCFFSRDEGEVMVTTPDKAANYLVLTVPERDPRWESEHKELRGLRTSVAARERKAK